MSAKVITKHQVAHFFGTRCMMLITVVTFLEHDVDAVQLSLVY